MLAKIESIRKRYLCFQILLIAVTLQLCNSQLKAQNILETPYSENDTIPNYPDDDQRPVIPTDVPADLNASFPKPGAIFKSLGTGKYFKWKTDLYERIGLKLGFSYAVAAIGVPKSQVVSENATNIGAGGAYLVELQWKLFNKDDNYEGSITTAFDGRHGFGSILPGELFSETGSIWGLDATFLPWDPYFTTLFWEQHLKKGRFWFRIGNIQSAGVLDFFRFKDGRVSFTSPNLTAPVHVIPFTVPSLGFAFNWKPVDDSSFYIAGAVQDINNRPGDFDWSLLFEYGEVFAGLEFGKHWFRGPGDFDQAHILIFYADKVSSAGATIQDQFIPLPTKSGWGIKFHGTKQWNKLIAFANYTYNTAEGGIGGALTNASHNLNLGIARIQPFNVQGEFGASISFADPNSNRVRAINNPENPSEFLFSHVYGQARDEVQYGGEVYWRILLFPDLWVTPGAQLMFNPTFNTRSDILFAPQIKARLFF